MNPIRIVVLNVVQMIIARGFSVSPIDAVFARGLITFDDYMTSLKVMDAVESGAIAKPLETIEETATELLEIADEADPSQEDLDLLSQVINEEGEAYQFDPYESSDKILSEIRGKMLRRFTRPRTQEEQDRAEILATTVHDSYRDDLINRDHTMELAILGPMVGHAEILSDGLSQVTQVPTVDEVIMVLDAPLNYTPRTAIQSWNIKVEQIMSEDMFVNPTEHYLYAHHELLHPEEAQEILTQLGLPKSKMPRIQQRDPVARFHGWVRGDLIKIHRPATNAMAGEYQYRVVV